MSDLPTNGMAVAGDIFTSDRPLGPVVLLAVYHSPHRRILCFSDCHSNQNPEPDAETVPSRHITVSNVGNGLRLDLRENGLGAVLKIHTGSTYVANNTVACFDTGRERRGKVTLQKGICEERLFKVLTDSLNAICAPEGKRPTVDVSDIVVE